MTQISVYKKPWLLVFFMLLAFNYYRLNGQNTAYYVSITGDDIKGQGTLLNPWRTIQKAANTLIAGDTCYIRHGVYRETVTPLNSGTNLAPIVYRPYPGETVTISGTDKVSGWVLDSGYIYKAPVSMNFHHEDQVFYKGNLIMEARWPNTTDWFAPNLAEADTMTTSQYLVDVDLPDYDWSGGKIWIHDAPAWSNFTQNVTAFGSNYLVTDYVKRWDNHNLTEGSKYFVSGVKEALDAANEWYYDSKTSTLYVWITEGDNPETSIEVKQRMTAFDLNGKSNIQLFGLKIVAADIKTNVNCSNLVFDSLNIIYPYFSDDAPKASSQSDKGILLLGKGHKFINNELSWSSGTGLSIQGSSMDIINNYIHDCDFIGTYAAPLSILRDRDLNNNTILNEGGHMIAYNTISRSGRSSMSIPGLHNSIIQYNEMSHVGYLTDDLGIIYGSYIEGGKSEFRYNLFHSNVSKDKSMGIYFDHGCQNFLCHHNISWNTEHGICCNHYALGMSFYNNTALSNGKKQFGFNSHWSNKWPHDMYGSRFINNILSQKIYCDGIDIVIDNNLEFYTTIESNKYLPVGSTAIDTGIVEEGITNEFLGILPDLGAIEKDGFDWTLKVGHDFANPPTHINREKANFKYWNKVENNAFERGSLVNWKSSGENVSMNYEFNNQSIPLTNTTMSGYWSVCLGDGINTISQVVTELLPNSSYEFRMRMRVPLDETAYIGVKNFGGAEIISSNVTNNSPNWSDTRVRFTTGATNTKAEIYATKSSSNSGLVYLDDASVFYFDQIITNNKF